METNKRTDCHGHGRPQAVAPDEEGLGLVCPAGDVVRLAFRYLRHLIDNHERFTRTLHMGTTERAVLRTLDEVRDIIDAVELMLTGTTPNEEK